MYSVDGPNSLWHIDDNHKLIKWRFVVHGGIDGFSQTIVYLHFSTNNRSSTVLDAFTNAVREYVFLAKYVLTLDTERIERLWRDVNRCVGVLFADLFREMEHDGILNSVDELDLFCLHVTFLRTIPRYPRNITGHRISSL